MQITKRNGSLVFFDTDKIAASILKANSGVPLETVSEKKASILAGEVMERVVEENELVTTADVQHTVYTILKEKALTKTAENYKTFADAKIKK